MKSLIITGPESTGKTTIAEYLSTALNIQLIEEYSRTYLESTQGKYGYNDIETMAKNAYSIIDSLSADKIILDTDIITYKIWSQTKYFKSSDWIEERIKNLDGNLYLLCYPDIPWVHDPLRESQHERKDLFRKYEQLLISYNFSYFIISGNKEVRMETALDLATNYFF